MPTPKQIQINIPNPCSQPWEEMTLCGQGRFCGQCQKTVIDFTAWSDAAMYRFFSENTGKVCGRFLSTQVGRPIRIPPQPHSRLYRMTVALGLTLIFTQATDAVAQNRPPLTAQGVAQKHVKGGNHLMKAIGEIQGCVTDGNKRSVTNATVQAYRKGVLMGGAVTDGNGMFRLQFTQPGKYDIEVTYAGGDLTTASMLVGNGDTLIHNFTLCQSSNEQGSMAVITAYKRPIVDNINLGGATIITGEEIIEPGTDSKESRREHRRKSRNRHRK